MLGAGTERERQEQCREFVESAAGEGLAESPWERLEAGLVLGGKEFVGLMRRLAKGNAQQQPALRALQPRCELAEIVRYVEQLKGQRWAVFRDQHADWGRDMVLWLARKLAGLKLRELAELASVTTEATVALAVKRLTY